MSKIKNLGKAIITGTTTEKSSTVFGIGIGSLLMSIVFSYIYKGHKVPMKRRIKGSMAAMLATLVIESIIYFAAGKSEEKCEKAVADEKVAEEEPDEFIDDEFEEDLKEKE